MIKKSWLFLLPLIATLTWVGSSPARASGESWSVTGVNTIGCANNTYSLDVHFAGVDGDPYLEHTTVASGGKLYTNEADNFAPTDPEDDFWGLYHDDSYGPVNASYPIPAGHPVYVTLSLERPKGHVLSSWSFVAASCDSNVIAFNESDIDQDFKGTTDACPTLHGLTADGCPLRARTLSLKARYGPTRLKGKLVAPGYPALYAGLKVKIWKKRPGPDKKVGAKITNSNGKFTIRVGSGRYYATAPARLVASAGEVTATRSRTVGVH